MTKKTILFISFLLITTIGYGQTNLIEGTVTDSITGEGLPYASLVFKETTTGTATDMDGHFELTLPERTETLEVSYLGYETKRLTITPHHHGPLDISLVPDGIILHEVVVKPQKEKYTKKNNPAV